MKQSPVLGQAGRPSVASGRLDLITSPHTGDRQAISPAYSVAAKWPISPHRAVSYS